ncbi:MAG: hypothetical protein JW797_14670 [Bradymonadales bacterium]|nr:hypothetical protein [Bradymonadales bacterium]
MASKLAGMDYPQQESYLAPAAPVQLHLESDAANIATPPVQMMAGPVVQMKPVKTHGDISSLIPEAQMGPYMYIPEAKRFIANDWSGLSEDQLWNACLETTSYGPETVDVPDVAKSDKTRRIEMARRRLGVVEAAMKQVLAHNNGDAPRAFTSVLDEYGKNNHAHCHDRHVYGAGTIGDRVALAYRAGWRIPFAPGADGVASAFKNIATANSAVSSAITGTLVANWKTLRLKIARGSQIDAIDVPLPGNIEALQKTDDPVGTAYADTAKPKYRGGNSYRPLYPGEPEWDSAKGSAPENEKASYSDTAKANPLTKDAVGSLSKVHVVIRVDSSTDGGWYVLTAYPCS